MCFPPNKTDKSDIRARSPRRRYAKGTVALIVLVFRIHAAVRSFCTVTEKQRTGSIARERRAGYAHGTSEACNYQSSEVLGTQREERPGSARLRIVSFSLMVPPRIQRNRLADHQTIKTNRKR